MKTIEIQLFKFNELSEEAKQKAINNLSDINLFHDWYQFTYDDAKEIGLKIKGFDLDRGSYCKGDFLYNGEDVANRILKNHGENCETYKTAKNYLEDYEKTCKEYAGEEHDEERLEVLEDLENEFLNSLLEDYRIILQNEYEYQTSEEAIIETIKANEYDFTADGKLY